ncbi:hypothetical protein [[Mycoplasma] testudinis]|uniref:hypothetical protein n=1 Tax=[Mycoplasma] testudinis TaxID=33924 RepID=UPI0004874D71|nr:hypothetical protein [[Mycoplasma] testudinis]
MNKIIPDPLRDVINQKIQEHQQENSSNQQIELKKSKFNLDFERIINSPVDGFYNHVSNHLDNVIDEFIQNEFVDNNANQEAIQKQTQQIKHQEEAIVLKKKELKIIQMKWRRAVIFILFFVLIGFAFWKPFQKARRAIKEFNSFKKNAEQLIKEATFSRFEMLRAAFSTFQLRDIYEYVFSQFGIRISELLPKKQLFEILKDPNIVDFESGLVGLYRNNPFYDVLIKYLNYRNVTTQTSATFPYWTTETVMVNGRMQTRRVLRYETLVGYHQEMTPFIDYENRLFFITNFGPGLSFKVDTDQKRDKSSINFENPDFEKHFNAHTWGTKISEVEQKQRVKEVFSINSQEEFMKWYKLRNGIIHNFCKDENALMVFNKNPDINNILNMFRTIDSVNILERSVDVDLPTVTNRLKKLVHDYFEKIFQMLQVPLLSPIFSREWYRPNANYNIANNIQGLLIDVNGQDKIDYSYTPNRFFDIKNIWYTGNFEPKRPSWFRQLKQEAWSNDVKYNCYELRSFWSEVLIDQVTVIGVHVGAKILAVPFERFYEMAEQKHLCHLYFNSNIYCRLIVSSRNERLIFDNLYKSEDILQMVESNKVWCNNPSWLDSYKNKSAIIRVVGLFQELNQHFNNSLVLIIEQYGAYLISNSQSFAGYESQICNLLVQIRNIFE